MYQIKGVRSPIGLKIYTPLVVLKYDRLQLETYIFVFIVLLAWTHGNLKIEAYFAAVGFGIMRGPHTHSGNLSGN